MPSVTEQDVARSFFIGVGLFFAFVLLAPFTMLYIFGEQYQGRRRGFWDTSPGTVLFTCTIAWFMFLPLIIGALR